MPPLVPTSRRDLLQTGACPEQLKADLRAGRAVAPFRGVHVSSVHATGFLARLAAAVATQATTSVLTLMTAAVVHGLRWLPASWSEPAALIHIAVDRDDDRRHRRGIRLHRRLLHPTDVTFVDGFLCFTVTRTLVELARDPRLPMLLVVQLMDGAIRDKRTSQAQLLECLGRMPGERYVARARAAVLRSREGVDSPKETEMRLMLEDGGVRDLDVNIEITDHDGLLLARGDLGKKDLLIWGEYDGYDEHIKRPKFRGDRVGDRWLAGRGWYVMRFVDEDFRRPSRTCREWQRASADAPARVAALPASRSPEVAEARRRLGLD